MDIAKKLLVIVTSGIIGACLGFMYTNGSSFNVDNCRILYVAEDELIELEQVRVQNDDLNSRQLFFGEIAKAVNLVTTLPKAYQSPTIRVVYSTSSVRGENVTSISSEIHEKIIKELSKKYGNNQK